MKHRLKPPQEVRFRDLQFGQSFKFYSGLDLVLVRSDYGVAKYERGTVDMTDAIDARVYPRPLPPRSKGSPSDQKGWIAFLVHLIKKGLQK